ncbi:MAG: methenyltetrahydromethanopterin cyclohydrolase [Anaerolineae bacterium]|nr:methenyltetrahydromethanopterin cyclohydrolase [Anaerolineae bacterium]
MLSINREAMKIVRKIMEAPEAIGAEVTRLPNGTTILDMGLKARGGWVAGKYYTLITLGGIGEVTFEDFPVGKYNLHGVRVLVDLPMEACLGSQIAGWRLEAKKDAPIGAGPARSLNKNPDHYMELIPYRDQYHEGVLAIQTPVPITVETANAIAESCGIKPENLYILVAASASLATAIQVSARIIEQTLHRLDEEGFDVNAVKLAEGYCVIPPLSNNEVQAFGWINDALLYGGIATLHVESTDEAVKEVIHKIVSSASSAFGRPFVEIYEEAGRDFYNIPLDLHSPAAVQINNMTTGHTFRAGEIAYNILLQSYFGEQP